MARVQKCIFRLRDKRVQKFVRLNGKTKVYKSVRLDCKEKCKLQDKSVRLNGKD